LPKLTEILDTDLHGINPPKGWRTSTVFYFGLAEGKATTDCADYTDFLVLTGTEKGVKLAEQLWRGSIAGLVVSV